MKNVRTLIACLSLIIAGILFSTGSAYAAGGDSKGGDTTCTSQLNAHGNPVIRCVVSGTKSDDSDTTVKQHHWHHHHYHHRFYHSWRHCHFRHHSHHFHHSYHHHH